IGSATEASDPGDEEIVARVNGIAITKGDVRTHVGMYERAHPGLPSGKARQSRARAALQTLMDNVLKEQVAREMGISISNEQVEARQIIVLTPDLADRLYRQLKEGADFAKLAESTSTDSSRTRGGDLGWVAIGSHYPPWDDIVFKLKPGEISQPFRSPHGYHIVRVEEHRAAGWGRPEDKRDRLEEMIRGLRSNKEYDRRIEEARKRATIWIADGIDLDTPVASPSTSR